jgi:RecA-family ATPase
MNLANYGNKEPISDDLFMLVNRSEGYRLIILDTFTLFHNLDENKNEHMSYMISCLKYLGAKTKASVLLLQPTHKQPLRESDAIITNIRYVSYLSFMSKEETSDYENIYPEDHKFYLKIGIFKQNYGIPEPERWLKRMEGGILKAVNLIKANKYGQTSSRVEEM